MLSIQLFLLALLVSYTCVFALQEGKIPNFLDKFILQLREKYVFFEKLFSCAYCLGFWTGILSYSIVYLTARSLTTFHWTDLLFIPLAGLASSTFCYVVAHLTEDEPSEEEKDFIRYMESLEQIQGKTPPNQSLLAIWGPMFETLTDLVKTQDDPDFLEAYKLFRGDMITLIRRFDMSDIGADFQVMYDEDEDLDDVLGEPICAHGMCTCGTDEEDDEDEDDDDDETPPFDRCH